MKRKPKFEIRAANPGTFWGVLVSGNGQIVWTTETYQRKAAVRRAIDLLEDVLHFPIVDTTAEIR